MKRKIIISSAFIVLSFLTSTAQNSLNINPVREYKAITLEECIERAVEANYSVVISGNNLEITRNNVTLAPFLPTVALSSRQSSSTSDQRNFSSEGVRENSVVKNASVINSASLSWRLFDGFAMFATRERQQELLSQGEHNFRSVIENLVMRISAQYYQIISMQNQVNLLTELVAISQVRYTQALTRYNIGSDSGLEYKQAKIYLNSDSSRLMLQKENLRNAYIELYSMMNVSLESEYSINDTIIPLPQLDIANLLESADNNNTTLNSLRAGEKIAALDTKLAKAARLPLVDFSAGYNYNFNRNQYFPSKFNESNGMNWGFSLSVPLFNGNEINRRVKNARISQENAKLTMEKEMQDIESEIRQLYNLYNNNMRLIAFEEESRELAYLNLEAAMEKYRLGSLSGIEFRDYQLSYLDASNRKMNTLYQAKVSEITLLLMAGNLFQ